MFINVIPSGYIYVVDNNHTISEFKSNLFKHAVSIKKHFTLEMIPELLSVINAVDYKEGQKEISFDGEVFKFRIIINS